MNDERTLQLASSRALRGGWRRRLGHGAALAALIGCALAGSSLPGVARAAAFARSNPKPGEVISSSPQRLQIFTNIAIAASASNAIDVRAADLREVDQGDVTIDLQNARAISVGLQPALGAGRYVATFVTALGDGTVDRGQFSFYVGISPSNADRAADARLSVGDGAAQPVSTHSDPTSALAVGLALGVAGVISAGTTIALRRRARANQSDW